MRPIHKARKGNLCNKIDDETSLEIPLTNFSQVLYCIVLIFWLVLQEELAEHIHEKDDLEAQIDVVGSGMPLWDSKGSEVTVDVGRNNAA